MGSKTATVIIFVIVAIIAICCASLFAAMTGTYSFNFGDDNGTVVNHTGFDNSEHQGHNYNYDNNHASQEQSQQEVTPEEPVNPPTTNNSR